jgi:hypothetical protein
MGKCRDIGDDAEMLTIEQKNQIVSENITTVSLII